VRGFAISFKTLARVVRADFLSPFLCLRGMHPAWHGGRS
jgi:hypothetical protein